MEGVTVGEVLYLVLVLGVAWWAWGYLSKWMR